MQLVVIFTVFCFQEIAMLNWNQLNNRLARLGEAIRCSELPVSFNQGAFSCTPTFKNCEYVIKFTNSSVCTCQWSNPGVCRCKSHSDYQCAKIQDDYTSVIPSISSSHTTNTDVSITTQSARATTGLPKASSRTAACDCLSLGALVGAILAAVMATLMAGLALLWFCWKRIRNKMEELQTAKSQSSELVNQDHDETTHPRTADGHDACVFRNNSIYATGEDDKEQTGNATPDDSNYYSLILDDSNTTSAPSGAQSSSALRRQPSNHIYLDLMSNTGEVAKRSELETRDVYDLAKKFG